MTEILSAQHFDHAVKIAIEALKSLLLVNGGAATALVALSSKAKGGPDYRDAILLFGAAALCNAATMVIGYFSQLSHANHCMAIESEDAPGAAWQLKKHDRLQTIAVVMVAASLLASAGGMIAAFRAA